MSLFLRVRSLLPPKAWTRRTISTTASLCEDKEDNTPKDSKDKKDIANVSSLTKSKTRRINRPDPEPGTDLTHTPLSYTLSNPDPTKQTLTKTLYTKPYESTYKANRPIEDAMERAFDHLRLPSKRKTTFHKEGFLAYYDVAIIGGGAMGCAVAYWLATRMNEKINTCVIERDNDYRRNSSSNSLGCLRQQYSQPENVELSLFGADFLRNANRLLHVSDFDQPDIRFQPHGTLILADEEQAEQMQRDHQMQTSLGVKAKLLMPKALKQRFPWINTDGVALASYGFENEGWYDSWALMAALRIKAQDLGVDFIPGDVYNMAHRVTPGRLYKDEEEDEDERTRKWNKVEEVHVYLDDGDVWPVTASQFILCGGGENGHLAHLAGIGSGESILRVPLPVEPRKRFTYYVTQEKGPGLNCPVVVDPTGAYFRREGYGGRYVCGRPPSGVSEEPDLRNSEVDYGWFEEKVWPELANRVPAFEQLHMEHATATFHDYNFYDGNPVIGPHPHHTNVWFATGLTGQGVQQAPGIGRAIMEMMLDDGFQTINLDKFAFARILEERECEQEKKTMA